MPVQFINAEEACRLVPDRANVGLIGGGGGLVEASLKFTDTETHCCDKLLFFNDFVFKLSNIL